MELIKKQIHYIREGKCVSDRFYLEQDINVPNARCDVRKIIYGQATVKAEEIRPAEKYLRVTGRLYYQILYITAEAQPQIDALQGDLPFEEMAYVGADDMEACFIRNIRNEFTCSLIHSRKISLRVMTEMEIGREKLMDEEAAVDVKPDADIYKKMKKAALLELHTSKKDTYRVKEEIRLPGSKESIGRVLITNISVRKFQIRLGNGGISFGGDLLVFCMYRSDEGKTDWIEQSLPFDGKIECTDVTEDMYYSVQRSLEDTLVDARPDEDGEMRALLVEGSIALRMNIYKEEEIELLKDMYSLKHKTDLAFSESDYEELLVQNHSKCKISEQLKLRETKGEILSICHSDGEVRIERAQQTEEGLLLDGVLHLSFIYLQADDGAPFGSSKETIPFSYLLECPETSQEIRFNLSGHVEQLSVSLTGGKDAEVKAVLAFDAFLRRLVRIRVITEAKAAEFAAEETEKRPGIVGYIVKEGDELWDLAKTYLTTVKRIQDVNAIESEVIRPGEKLLILKENMTIL